MISDHTSYNFTLGNGYPGRELRVYFNVKTTTVRGYHAYRSM